MSAPKIIQCSACGENIVFLPTEAGRWMPVDADSVFDIEFEIPDMDAPMFDRRQGHMTHFATCPDAANMRRTR